MSAKKQRMTGRGLRGELASALALVGAALFTALAAASIIMFASGVDLPTIALSFWSLLEGSMGSAQAISETLVAATPLTLAGLGIAVGFRTGLFNIGAEGQILIGGMCGLIAGFSITGLSPWVHIPIALFTAFIGGALWGGIAGWLKVATGAHEVITTIMLNFIALRLSDYLLRNPPVQNPGRNDPISRHVGESARLPHLLDFIDPTLRVDAGIILAVVMTITMAWLINSTKLGFEFRILGANSIAARFAGIRTKYTIVVSMMLAGGLAGLAGASLTLGVLGRASPNFSAHLGFEAIAVALLARSNPTAVLFAGLLFGALQAGGRRMQVVASVSIDLITIVEALVVLCIAAPILIRVLYPWLFSSEEKS